LLNFYIASRQYIDYLRQTDARIYEWNEKRPYIGVVCSVNEVSYYIALTSPKPKHKHMQNTKDFHKIKGGVYGVINFNYMIPIHERDLTKVIIKDEPDDNYRNLLSNQYAEIVKIQDVIRKKANALYALVMTDDGELSPYDLRTKRRCCDFALLEQKMKAYIGSKQDAGSM